MSERLNESVGTCGIRLAAHQVVIERIEESLVRSAAASGKVFRRSSDQRGQLLHRSARAQEIEGKSHSRRVRVPMQKTLIQSLHADPAIFIAAEYEIRQGCLSIQRQERRQFRRGGRALQK